MAGFCNVFHVSLCVIYISYFLNTKQNDSMSVGANFRITISDTKVILCKKKVNKDTDFFHLDS